MMRFLIDMNLSPAWREVFVRQGWPSVHWSTVGDPRAPDAELMRWARDNEHIVFTNDLDFTTILATTSAGRPSVVQVRTHDLRPASLEAILVPVLRQHEAALLSGAVLTLDKLRERVRILPF